MKTKRHNDKNGYNPQTVPLKPNTRYVVSEKSRKLWDAVMKGKRCLRDRTLDEKLESLLKDFCKDNGLIVTQVINSITGNGFSLSVIMSENIGVKVTYEK